MLEKFLSIEDKVGFIKNLTDSEKLSLYQEIAEDSKQRDVERIKNETILKGLEQDRAELMDKVKELGFASVEDMRTAYDSLCNELDQQCIEYANILNNVGGSNATGL